jgi:hypothetical protein
MMSLSGRQGSLIKPKMSKLAQPREADQHDISEATLANKIKRLAKEFQLWINIVVISMIEFHPVLG